MTEAFNDLDIHSATAVIIQRFKQPRYKAKTVTWYIAELAWFVRTIGYTTWRSQRFIDGYFESYPDVAKYRNKQRKARENGYVETLLVANVSYLISILETVL